MTIEIQLTRGYVAIIDDEDAYLAEFKWQAAISKGGLVYATRSTPRGALGRQGAVKLHREVLGLKPGDPLVDHRDGDGLNCRRSNLRVSTYAENGRNRAGPRVDNTSGFLGVYRRGRRFRAQIRVDGVDRLLGNFDTPEQAHAARLAAEREFFGIQPRRAEAHGVRPC